MSAQIKRREEMTLVLLIAISMMWFPFGCLHLGVGEGKTVGAITGFVGVVTVVGGMMQATPMFGSDAFGAALLVVFGLLYLQLSYCILAGIEDLRSFGLTCLMLAIICAIYGYLWATGGGVKPDGTTMIGKTPYLVFMMVDFVVLLVAVCGLTFGKISGKVVGALLVILTFVGLLVPAFDLLAYGKLPF
jgi:putative amide transporter protein